MWSDGGPDPALTLDPPLLTTHSVVRNVTAEMIEENQSETHSHTVIKVLLTVTFTHTILRPMFTKTGLPREDVHPGK